MTYFPDLAPCDYFDDSSTPEALWSQRLRAVGWLEWGHRYTRGAHYTELLEKLRLLLTSPWEPECLKGVHFCTLCTQATDDPLALPPNHRSIPRGNANVFVPGDGVVYVAPELILHYIEDHTYQPPSIFWEAVHQCPPMHSEEYYKAVCLNGPPSFTELVWE